MKERIGGVKYTIKDGIVYDAKQLLEDVARMVEEQKKERAAAGGWGSKGRAESPVVSLHNV